jgi:hypothetical protein
VEVRHDVVGYSLCLWISSCTRLSLLRLMHKKEPAEKTAQLHVGNTTDMC